ncbi:hypothetical protein FORC81_p348 (plasmid) [Escherichia coli]|nr:hypothetical protein FORC81_p348 [Escherichia coli]
MSALLLPFHHGLLPGFQCLTLFRLTRAIHASSTWYAPNSTGWPQSTRQKKAIQGLL